jgi:hypothetical protein
MCMEGTHSNVSYRCLSIRYKSNLLSFVWITRRTGLQIVALNAY